MSHSHEFLDNSAPYGGPCGYIELLMKAIEQDVLKKSMPLPFQPEAVSTMRARYVDAVSVVYDARPDKTVKLDIPGLRPLGVNDWPGICRKHVFDFKDGTRIVISREVFDAEIGTVLHWSAQISQAVLEMLKELGMSIPEVMEIVMCHMHELWGGKAPIGEVKVSIMPDIMHFTYIESQSVTQCALEKCQCGNPSLN